MTVDIQSRLSKLDEEFLISLNEGTPSLTSFEKSWSSLVNTMNTKPHDSATIRQAHIAAHRVRTIATEILNIHQETAAFGASLMADLNDLLNDLTLEDITSFQTKSPSPPIVASSNHPQYIAPAYRWLLKNIHNPYPSKETKRLISQRTHTSVQNIDAWFLNVRRRIGWTSLSRQYFSGSRPTMVAAAKRALLEDDSDAREPLPANIRMAFVQMEAVANELYSNKFSKSALAGKLDGMVKDMTFEDIRRRKREVSRKRAEMKARRSFGGASEQFNGDLGGKEARALISPPLSIAGKKRRLSEDFPGDGLEIGLGSSRHAKRSRRILSISSSSADSSTESLFSVCSSRASSCALSVPEDESPASPLATHVDLSSRNPPTVLPAQRSTLKRRLSEAGVEPAPKRQMLVRPRPHAVSDPLPKLMHSDVLPSTPSTPTSSLPSPLFEVASVPGPAWSSLFFDTPGTAVLDELDLSVLREPEFSCIAESAALLNVDDREFNEFMNRGSDPLTIQNLLDVSSYHGTDYLFALNHSDSAITWPYSDMTQLSTPVSSKLDTQSDEPLTSLDDLSSLSSLPVNPLTVIPSAPTSDAAPSTFPDQTTALNSLEHIDWLSIIPQSLSTDGFPSNPAFAVVDKALHVQSPTELGIVPSQPVAGSTLLAPIAPLTITPETRAEKYKQYRELMNKAKQLEAELGQS